MTYQLESDTFPRFVGVDMGRKGGDVTTECEIERLPDGTIRVLDVRQYPVADEWKGE